MDRSLELFHRDCLTLTSHRQRIELHIRSDEDGTVTLYAFSGPLEQQPDRHIQQGPFQRREQAVGARRAIAAELLAAGFRVDKGAAIWLLPLQRHLNAARQQRLASTVNCRFDPSDVYLDW